MPVETASETTEQQVSTVEEGSPKQSEPDLPDIEFPDNDPIEPTPSSSTNVLTNGLKRPLPEGVDGEKRKKFRLTELSDDELEVTNKDDDEKNRIERLLQKVSESLENTSDDESNVSNKTQYDNLKNQKKSSFNHNDNNEVDKGCEKDYINKNILSKDNKERKKKKPSEILLNILNNVEKNLNDTSECIGNGNDTVNNCKNKLTKNSNGIACLNKSLSSDNLGLTEKKSTAVNESNLSNTNENIVNCNKNDAEPLQEFKNKTHLTKNTDETKSIESSCNNNTNNSKKADVCSNGIDQEFEVIDSDDSSDNSSPDAAADVNNIIIGVNVPNVAKESFPELLKLFTRKDFTYEHFDSICTKKIAEMMTDCRTGLGKMCSDLQSLKKKEKFWRSKYYLLERQFKEMTTIVSVQQKESKSNEFARPHIVTRTVGLQAVSCPKKEGSMKLSKQAIPLPKADPVSISVEDDDDVVILEFETVKFASSSTSNISNTTTKKQIPPLVTTSKTPVVSPKNVTASPKTVAASPKTVTGAKSLNPINVDTTPTTIDLTGNDDVTEESNIINLDDSISPIQIPRRIAASLLPAGTLVNGNSGKTITYLELPKNPSSSSSSVITGTASRSPQRTIVLNKDTINTSPKSKNLKPFLIDVSGTLQPMSTASYTPRQITVSPLSGSMPGVALPETSPGKLYTCRVPITLSTGCQSTRKPPPPAIPLLRHPSPVPGIPNQRSLPTWKRLPPAPKLTIKKTPGAQNSPHSTLVLSWSMDIDQTIAEIISYQIYAYQETPDQPPNIELWKKIGDVKALAPPMACSLTHFSNGQKYHFLVRAVDVYTRVGSFSNPESIL